MKPNLIRIAEPLAAPPLAAVEMSVRKASMTDIGDLLRLINQYASEGIMLPRTELEMAEHIRDFTVACSGERLAGCGALHFYSPDSAEIRSLAVVPGWKQNGIGTLIAQGLEQEARQYGLRALFAFTYVPRFFHRLGYREVDRGDLPLKVWKDCLRCPKFNNCDETAVQKLLWVSQGIAELGPITPQMGGESPQKT